MKIIIHIHCANGDTKIELTGEKRLDDLKAITAKFDKIGTDYSLEYVGTEMSGNS